VATCCPHSIAWSGRWGSRFLFGTRAIRSSALCDLADIFDLTQSHSTRPGVTVENGLCKVIQAVTVPDSAFYTFTVEGDYTWTVSRDELSGRNWLMNVVFLS
jgi:hypothetical protein